MIRYRIAASVLGVVLALAAIARDDKRIAWAAIVVLAVAVILRVIARRRA